MRTRLLLFALLAPAPAPVLAQSSGVDCCSRFDYVLEKTILKVDAVRIEMEIRDEAADRVEALLGAWSRSRSVEDSVAALYLSADDANIRMTFLVSVSLGRFLGGVRNTLEGLAEVGILSRAEADRVYAGYVERFSVLDGRGIKDGDVMERELRGDTVSTRFTAVTGETPIDEISVGSERRREILGAFFSRKSDFRDGLIDQVFDRVEN
jgi:hypothetical protein